MAARPPPARPHNVMRPTNYFGTYGTAEWADEDAWDSGSDEETAAASSRSRAPSSTSKSPTPSAPKPVPRPLQKQSSSSSTLAFSYTHVSAPSPSSYPRSDLSPPIKTGWTIVRKSEDHRGGEGDAERNGLAAEGAAGDDELIMGDMDPDVAAAPPTARLRQDQVRCIVREDVDAIVDDPLHLVTMRPRKVAAGSTAPSREGSPDSPARLEREQSIRSNKRRKFVDCLADEDVNMAQLRKLAWSGIPDDLRPIAWSLLLGYLPLSKPARSSTLSRKRKEYTDLVEITFSRGREALDQQIWHQIEIDVPRTRPGVRLWMHGAAQRSLERILYVWAIRHPASGYVQGINDLVTPFFQVFLSAYIDSDPEQFDPTLLPERVLNAIEADSFWCLSRLLDGIQDNYIAGQPGIQRSVKRMAELVARIDAPLAAHLDAQNVEFMQFAFRWMNCLLMREITVRNTIRMWDTYLSEGPDAFSQFHLYVCCAFLTTWSEKLREMDFQGIIMFLQSLPTQDWTDHDMDLLLSKAFVLSSTWQNAQSHFVGR